MVGVVAKISSESSFHSFSLPVGDNTSSFSHNTDTGNNIVWGIVQKIYFCVSHRYLGELPTTGADDFNKSTRSTDAHMLVENSLILSACMVESLSERAI